MKTVHALAVVETSAIVAYHRIFVQMNHLQHSYNKGTQFSWPVESWM